MAKKLTSAERIRRYIDAHPSATPKQIAEALNVKPQHVYVVRSNDKKRLAEGKPIRRIKKSILNATEVKLAQRLGIDPALYAKSKKELKNWNTVFMATTDKPLPVTMEEPKADPVNHPPHYKVGGIETIDFIEAKQLNYNLGNVVKYITRADHKGNRKQDLEKAMWYLKREVEQTQGA